MSNHKASEFISAMLHSASVDKQDFKKCSVCGEIKSIDQFHRNPRSKDGKRHECRECRENHAKPIRKTKKSEKDWYSQFSPI